MDLKLWQNAPQTEKEAELTRENLRLRRENRQKMWTATKKMVKWGLITTGAVAIYNAVTPDNEPCCEDEQV